MPTIVWTLILLVCALGLFILEILNGSLVFFDDFLCDERTQIMPKQQLQQLAGTASKEDGRGDDVGVDDNFHTRLALALRTSRMATSISSSFIKKYFPYFLINGLPP